METSNSPADRSYLWEVPFWVGVAFWALCPLRWTPWITVGSIPLNSKDLVVFLLAGYYLSNMVFGREKSHPQPTGARRFLILAAALLLYALISMSWAGIEEWDAITMAYTLAQTGASFTLAYCLIAGRSPAAIRGFLLRMTIALALICSIYAAESFFSLGLRGPSGNDSEFGISRVSGPLFAASTGYWLALPALAYAVQQWLGSPTHRVYTLASIVILFITLFALGSRGGLIALLLFFILSLFVSTTWQRWRLAVFLFSVAILAAGLTFTVADSTRLGAEDRIRGVTHRTCLELVLNRNAGENIFGSGYASYWSWYRIDAETAGGVGVRFPSLTRTSYGYMLFLHPHSVLLLLTVELGFVGFISFLAFIWILAREFTRSIREARVPILACGIVSSCVVLFLELVIFRNSRDSTLWWVYFFGWLALNRASVPDPNKTGSKQVSLKKRSVERALAPL